MLATETAQKFVDLFCSAIPYSIEVMDTGGIVIAAKDTLRIGMYHETAHSLVSECREIAVTESEAPPRPGVPPGVCLPLRHHCQVVGVVGVTGTYPDVGTVAHTVRTAIEAMLEYERDREQLEHRQDHKRFFINVLLYKESPEAVQMIALARRCGYDPSLPRIPVVLEVPAAASPDGYLRAIMSSPDHTRQDISFIGSSGHITIFKYIPGSDAAIVDTIRRSFIGYCTAIDRECAAANIAQPQKYASGPLQDSLVRYRASLRIALWALNRDGDRMAFFTDHTHELLLNSIAPDVWHTVFDFLHARIRSSSMTDPAMLEQLGRTYMALREENMSFKKAALRLNVHRNTVIFRLNRLNDLFGLDPVTNRHDREMLYLFFSRLMRYQPHSDRASGDSETPFVLEIQNYIV